MTVIIASNQAELAASRAELAVESLALVPTMGALHEGHRSLIKLAKKHAEAVAVSIFVNPLQFGPNEDFSRYPRTFDTDIRICAEDGVALIFAPDVNEMYPPGHQVTVSTGEMGTILEGAFRPGHFDGVLTVVLKLFNLVRPEVAVFGQKDAQQLALIRRMVHDLDVPVRIVGGTIVRDPDGLAMSSRNRYLSETGRPAALALSRALKQARTAAPGGPLAVRAAAENVLKEADGLALDYLALVDPATFAEVGEDYSGEAVLAVAGRVGATRLIDNVPVTLP